MLVTTNLSKTALVVHFGTSFPVRQHSGLMSDIMLIIGNVSVILRLHTFESFLRQCSLLILQVATSFRQLFDSVSIRHASACAGR